MDDFQVLIHCRGSQCKKHFGQKFDRDAFPEVSETQQAIFDQGHEIGNMAKQLSTQAGITSG